MSNEELKRRITCLLDRCDNRQLGVVYYFLMGITKTENRSKT